MEIKLIKIGEIKPRPNNPKKHWVEKISESIREFGYVEPIVVDEGDVILAGHGRLKALREQGVVKVEVIVKRGLTEVQKNKYMLLSNKVCEAGGWDEELLEKFDEELLSSAGFSSEELDEIFEYEAKEDNFNAGEEYGKITEPKVKLGDLYQLGSHRLLCGDATKREDIEKLSGGLVDMIFTDPPFNINYHSLDGQGYSEGKYKSKKVFNDNLSEEGYLEFLKKALLNCYQFTKEKCAVFLWNGDRFLDIAIRACKETNWKINQLAVWIKNSFVFSPGCVFHKFLEYCVIAFKNGEKPIINKRYAGYHGNLIDLGFDEFQEHLEAWYVHRDSTQDYEHPTQKPVRLAEPALKAVSEIDDIVLDIFGGSGSTLIACEQLKRKCYMMELDPKYCEVIINRFEKFTGQKVIKL